MITQVDLLFRMISPSFLSACYFCTLTIVLPSFVHPSIFSTLTFHPSFWPTLFSCFILSLFFFFIPYFILLLCIVLLNVPQLCTPEPSLSSFFFFFCTYSILRIFMNIISTLPVQQPPTLTYGSSRATQACCMLLHAWMKFWEASLAATTSFIIVDNVSTISSTPCAVRAVRFSFVSCAFLFHLSLAVANSPITLNASSCNGPKCY
jgi:hypothetical protein